MSIFGLALNSYSFVCDKFSSLCGHCVYIFDYCVSGHSSTLFFHFVLPIYGLFHTVLYLFVVVLCVF